MPLPPIANELIPLLTNGIISNGGTKGGANTASSITDLITPILNGFANNPTYNSTRPKAFLNWIIVDEEFKEIASSLHKGVVQVPLITGATAKQLLVGLNNLKVRRNGWLYVYVSNESNQNVYFDDLIVNHKRGPVVSAQDYYPFGLEIAGLSTKAIGFGGNDNRYKYNGKELQSKEFSDGSGLEWADYGARMYDPQIGRWYVIDPRADNYSMVSPYNYALNNPIKYIDPDGKDVIIAIKGNTITVSAVVYISGKDADKSKTCKDCKETQIQKTVRLAQAAVNETYKDGKYVDEETGKEYDIKFDIQVKYDEKKKKESDLAEGENILNIDKKETADGINKVVSTFEFDKNNKLIIHKRIGYIMPGLSSNIVSHEIGHLLGFSDRYTIVKDPKTGEKTDMVSHVGYERDVMGANATRNLVPSHYIDLGKHVINVSNTQMLNRFVNTNIFDLSTKSSPPQ